MVNIVACQTLGEMSTPSRASAGQSSMQHATQLTQPRRPVPIRVRNKNTFLAQRNKRLK
jgi:hypothetical protein